MEKMDGGKKKIRKLIIAAFITAFLGYLLFFVQVAGSKSFDLIIHRGKAIDYQLVVGPKPGEVLTNVTVYLPSPRKNGHVQPNILKSLNSQVTEQGLNQDKRYASQATSKGIRLSEVSTKYGPMLRLDIPVLRDYLWLYGKAYGYPSFFPVGTAAADYPLEPMLEKQNEKVPVFATYDGGSALGIYVDYLASYGDVYFFGQYSGTHGATRWRVSKEKPFQYGLGVNENTVTIKKKGWSQVHVWVRES